VNRFTRFFSREPFTKQTAEYDHAPAVPPRDFGNTPTLGYHLTQSTPPPVCASRPRRFRKTLLIWGPVLLEIAPFRETQAAVCVAGTALNSTQNRANPSASAGEL